MISWLCDGAPGSNGPSSWTALLASLDAELARLGSASVEPPQPPVDFTLKVYAPRDGLWTITSSVPGLLLAGPDLNELLADVKLSVDTLRELNGHEGRAVVVAATKKPMTSRVAERGGE